MRIARTHYDVLGVDRTATSAEIRGRYRTLVKALHPDALVGATAVPTGSSERLAMVNAAWEVLGDPVRRARYDATLPPVPRHPPGEDAEVAGTVQRWQRIADGGFVHLFPAPPSWPGGTDMYADFIRMDGFKSPLVAPGLLRLQPRPGADFSALANLRPGEIAMFLAPPTGVSISDSDIAHLSDQSRLSVLHVPQARVGDAGVEALRSLPELRVLNLYGTALSDAGLASIARWQNIRDLNIGATRLQGHGLAALAAMPHLRGLDLRNTKVTEDHLMVLRAAPALEWVDIDYLGWGARRRLKRAMPKVDFR